MRILAIIPARFASTRFPGKPLIDIKGKTMIQRVYERSKKVFDDCIVATENQLIMDEVARFGGIVIATSNLHRTGTDRCAEALKKYQRKTGINFDVVINIQGDEPLVHKEHLEKVILNFNNKKTQISTLIKQITNNEDIFNPNIPKVLINKEQTAIYFSRSPIPFVRDITKELWHQRFNFYKHIGIYGYRSEVLNEITKLNQSELELAESLEQNRWIENGYTIKTALTDKENISIDSPDDLEKLLKDFLPDMETLF
jgi:3-deoxy-manno-octulosonate cytidylyltransferase (CMP-KDO synthetase)